MSAALVLTAGTMADRLGPRRLLAIGLLAYAGFSLLAALSPNAGTLIAARGLLGAAAVTVSPTIMVILRHIFSTDRQFAQLRLAVPLFDMRLFASPNFTVALAVLLLFLMAVGASYMQFAQYLQLVLGHSALNAGLLLIVPASLQIISTALAPRLLDWMRPSTAIACGAALAIAGMDITLIGTMLPRDMATFVMIAGDSLGAIGSGPVFAITASLIIASAPVERTGAASGAQEVAGSLGNLLGLALGGSLAVFIYQAAMTGIGAGAESIGHAVEHATSLSDADGAVLMENARAAFTHATRAVYGYAIVLLLAFITLTLMGLRKARLDQ